MCIHTHIQLWKEHCIDWQLGTFALDFVLCFSHKVCNVKEIIDLLKVKKKTLLVENSNKYTYDNR